MPTTMAPPGDVDDVSDTVSGQGVDTLSPSSDSAPAVPLDTACAPAAKAVADSGGAGPEAAVLDSVPVDSARPEAPKLLPGATVTVVGLIKRLDYNGLRGTVLPTSDWSDERVAVLLEVTPRKVIKVKSTNLELVSAPSAEPSECVFCLDAGDVPPILSGCACRGAQGLAHVECCVKVAENRQDMRDATPWVVCSTCKQPFTGPMQHELAQLWWSRVDSGVRTVDELVALATAEPREMHPEWFSAAFAFVNSRRDLGLIDEAVELMRLIQGCKKQMCPCGEACPNVMEASSELVHFLLDGKKYEEAVVECQKLLSMKKQFFGEEDEESIKVWSTLAVALCYSGELDKGVAELRAAVELSSRVHGSESEITLSLRGNLASLLLETPDSSNFAEAEEELRRVIDGSGRRRDMWVATSNLAYAINLQGRPDESMSVLQKLYAEQKRELGESNPATANTAVNIARALTRQNKHDEAIEVLRGVLELLPKSREPNVITVTEQLARALVLHGADMDEACRAVAAYLSITTADGTDQMHYLAGDLQNDGRNSDAERVLREILVVQETRLGKCHPDTVSTASMAVWKLCEQDKFAEAEMESSALLKIYHEELGVEHEDTLDVMRSLANAIGQQGRLKEAKAVYIKLITTLSKARGRKTAATLDAQNDLATLQLTHGDANDVVEAVATMREVFTLRREVLGPTHDDTVASVLLLSKGLEKLKEFVFQDNFGLVIAAAVKKDALTSSTAVKIAHRLARVHVKLGKMEAAVELLTETVEALVSKEGSSSLTAAKTAKSVARILRKDKRADDAAAFLRKMLSDAERDAGDDATPGIIVLKVELAITLRSGSADDADVRSEKEALLTEVIGAKRFVQSDKSARLAVKMLKKIRKQPIEEAAASTTICANEASAQADTAPVEDHGISLDGLKGASAWGSGLATIVTFVGAGLLTFILALAAATERTNEQ